MGNPQENPLLSVIVPVFNEEKVLTALYERTYPILSSITDNFEIIFVNDGSTDNSLDKIRTLCSDDNRVKLIDLSRNFGKEVAMSAGLDFCRGEAVVIIDADLQDPPELIPSMVEKWREGFDVVYATRTSRQGETFLKKATAEFFYRVIGRLSRTEIPRNTGDFRLMNRRTVEALKLLREQNRFMKGLFSWVGFEQVSIPYLREPRVAGGTKWNYWKLWNFAIEGITSFSYVPLQVAGYLGLLVAAVSFLYAAYLVIRTFLFGIDVPGYASLMVAILFFSGVQLLVLGVLGEYLGRISHETKRRPLYIIKDLAGIDPSHNQYVFLEYGEALGKIRANENKDDIRNL
ncbi:MAG: glycosyltransferase family 2 protein [Syntrophaceae bacterium]|nr:glycosyltransferase family 2 protein [Syntrophaceae bacterium]